MRSTIGAVPEAQADDGGARVSSQLPDAGQERHAADSRHGPAGPSPRARRGGAVNMRLGELKPASGAKKKRKRVGCGPGSGHGKTSCRGSQGLAVAHRQHDATPGTKAARCRSSAACPKRGFTNMFRVEYQVINLGSLDRFEANATIDVDALLDQGAHSSPEQQGEAAGRRGDQEAAQDHGARVQPEGEGSGGEGGRTGDIGQPTA